MKRLNDVAEKLGFVVGKVYGEIEPVVEALKPKKLTDIQILGKFIDNDLNRLLHGLWFPIKTRQYRVLGISAEKTVYLEIPASKSVWEVPIEARVFGDRNSAAWESFDNGSTLRLIMRSGSPAGEGRYYLYRDPNIKACYGKILVREDPDGHYIKSNSLTWIFDSISREPISSYLHDRCLKGWDKFKTTVFPNDRLIVRVEADGRVFTSNDLFAVSSARYSSARYDNPVVDKPEYFAHPSNDDRTTAIVSPLGDLRIYQGGAMRRIFNFNEPLVGVARCPQDGNDVIVITRKAAYKIATDCYSVRKTCDIVAITSAFKVYSKGTERLTLVVERDEDGSLVELNTSVSLPHDADHMGTIDDGLAVRLSDGTLMIIPD